MRSSAPAQGCYSANLTASLGDPGEQISHPTDHHPDPDIDRQAQVGEQVDDIQDRASGNQHSLLLSSLLSAAHLTLESRQMPGNSQNENENTNDCYEPGESHYLLSFVSNASNLEMI